MLQEAERRCAELKRARGGRRGIELSTKSYSRAEDQSLFFLVDHGAFTVGGEGGDWQEKKGGGRDA